MRRQTRNVNRMVNTFTRFFKRWVLEYAKWAREQNERKGD